MRREINYFVLIGCFVLGMFLLGAGPAEEGGQIFYFNAADQETTLSLRVSAVAWVSDQGSGLDIAVDDDMLLEDGTGKKIIGARAEATADDLVISFPIPLTVTGLKAEDLDGGVLYVYGQKR